MRKHNQLGKDIKKDYLEPIFENKYKHYIFVGLILLLLALFFFKMAFLGYQPKPGDTVQWRGAAQVLIEYNEQNRDQALWNSNLFSGMPGFLISYPNKFPFIKNIFDIVSRFIIDWRVLYMFLAGLGMYIFMLSLGFKPMVCFIAGISFALSCHFIGLIEIGHNTKYRAIVYIPWIFWSLKYLFKHRNVLGIGLTSLFLIQQLRENHVQITYYTFIAIAVYWIFSFFWAKKDGSLKQYLTSSVMLAAVFIISALAVSHPYLSVWEYGKYTIRGGAGLSADYATGWSFHPLEMITFIIPNFFGGISPYYWGWMPFTQTSMYMGVVIFALAMIAIFTWKERMVKMLTVVAIVALLFSFGRHFSLLSNLLLSYLPFFSKFRVPAMILVLVQFSFVILACYGIKEIFNKYRDNDQDFNRIIFRLMLVCLGILLVFIILSEAGVWQSLPLEHQNDAARYEPRQLEFLKSARLSLLEKSVMTSFGLLSGFFIITLLFLKRKGVSPYLYLLIIAVVCVTDIMLINKQHFDSLFQKADIGQDFVLSDADEFLLEDEDLFRIFPLREEFGNSRWAYYHQTIGGYHAAKLRRYQDILDNCLYEQLRYRVPINWNIVRMLNVKYFVSPVQLPFENLKWSFFDRHRRVTVYEYLDGMDRAWFVDEIEHLKDQNDIFRRLNSPEFDPAKTALVETELITVEPTNDREVVVTNYSLHNIELNVTTDKNSFLVISEIYYPVGWNAYLNGEKIPIHPVNHILRGLEIPQGEHTITMVFEPITHRLAVILSFFGSLASIVLVLIGGYFYYKQNYRGEIDYIVKG